MNFVKAMLAIQDYAAREALSCNELITLLAVFRVYNDRYWPEGAVTITNNELLSHTTFHGSKRDETLRAARARLVERGVLECVAGDRRKAQPQYRIIWSALGLALEIAPEIAPDIAPKKKGKNGGKGPDDNIYNKQAYGKNENGKHQTPAAVPAVCDNEGHTQARPAAWFDPARPDETGDNAWKYSEKARCAIAQRMIDHMAAQGMESATHAITDDYGQMIHLEGPDLFGVMVRCMEYGMPPGHIMRCAAGCWDTADWSTALKVAGAEYMGVNNVPLAWEALLEQLQADEARDRIRIGERDRPCQ